MTKITLSGKAKLVKLEPPLWARGDKKYRTSRKTWGVSPKEKNTFLKLKDFSGDFEGTSDATAFCVPIEKIEIPREDFSELPPRVPAKVDESDFKLRKSREVLIKIEIDV